MATLIRKAQASWRGTVDGHGELQHAITSEKLVKSAFKSWVKAQAEAASCLERWASKEDNPAIQDCFAKLVELNKLWTEVQLAFTDHIKDFRLAFESILAQELAYDAAVKHKAKCERHERTCEKEIQKLQKKGESTGGAEARLRQARSLRELAESTMETAFRDMEQFKGRVVMECIDRFGEAHLMLFEKGAAVFTGYKDLARLMPAMPVHLSTDPAFVFTGADRTARVVLEVTENVRNIDLLTARQITRSPTLGSGTPGSLGGGAAASAPSPALLTRSMSASVPEPRRTSVSRSLSLSAQPPAYQSADTAAASRPSGMSSVDEELDERASRGNLRRPISTPDLAVPPRPSAAALGYDTQGGAHADTASDSMA